MRLDVDKRAADLAARRVECAGHRVAVAKLQVDRDRVKEQKKQLREQRRRLHDQEEAANARLLLERAQRSFDGADFGQGAPDAGGKRGAERRWEAFSRVMSLAPQLPATAKLALARDFRLWDRSHSRSVYSAGWGADFLRTMNRNLGYIRAG